MNNAELTAELAQIYQARGELTPELVIEVATDEDHPLHSRYEWDDAVAGHEYRKVQAAADIRVCRVEFVDPSGDERSIRAFVSLNQAQVPGRRGYAPTEEVVADELTSRILLRELERKMAALKKEYGHLSEFAAIVRAAVA